MREIIAPVPLPKIIATKLKSNSPTRSHTMAPIITSVKAIIVVIFIKIPPFNKVYANGKFLYSVKVKLTRFLKLVCQKKFAQRNRFL